MYTLDTNAIIYYLKGDRSAISTLEDIIQKDVPIFVSTITETELFGFSAIRNEEIQGIEGFLTIVAIVPLDSRIARIAGFLRREYGMKIPDSVIGATALMTGTALVTRNVKDFKRVPNLSILKI